MPNTKPLVTAALICDDVIIATDGAPTIVRVVDNVAVALPPSLPPNSQPAIQVTAFFAVKAGDLTGDHEFSISVRRPGGKSAASQKWTVRFDGAETGGNLKLHVGLPAAVFGLYWLDLMWKGEVLSSTPFKVSKATPEMMR